MKRIFVLFSYIFFTAVPLLAQEPPAYQSAAIYEAIEKLNFLGSALYIAAHPDDENTRLISYFSHHLKARTAYLSLTRGDGGQNLIGSELRELLGVLRTQELLAARRIDGGEQLFTRANDFGYSKHPDETLNTWNKDEVLADVIRAIRIFKPDVIINRFNHRTAGNTHGHHTASALLSVEAFDKAANPAFCPQQLSASQGLTTWQPARLFFNTSWWFYGSEENFAKADKTNMTSIDVGIYYPLKGMSNNEIAALSSSQHRCQGFGRLRVRGSEPEYLEFIKGTPSGNSGNPFEGINTSWTRVKGGKIIGDILHDILKNFQFANPSAHLPKLLEAYQRIRALEDEHWRNLKLAEIEKIILACTGLYIEATATVPSASPGEAVQLQVEAINRSHIDIQFKNIVALPSNEQLAINETLPNNIRKRYTVSAKIAASQAYTAPCWLLEEGTTGMYKVSEPALIGKPETPRALSVLCNLTIAGIDIPLTREAVYKYADPSRGEIRQPFEILPPVTITLVNKVNIFTSGEPKEIPVTVKAVNANFSGNIELTHPANWQVSPERIPISIAQKGGEQTIVFKLIPPKGEEEGYVEALVHSEGRIYRQELVSIEYDHIPKQSVLLPAKAKVVRLNLQKRGERIGYIMGAGDEVPTCLRELGYQVTLIKPSEITAESLQGFDAIVMGIRAYNVVDELRYKQSYLLDYAAKGGTLVVQYNTGGRNGLVVDNIAPYSLDISGERVTDEQSDIQFLDPQHILLNTPNKIEKKDFEGWVQERGLYFPRSWAPQFSPVLSMKDPGEDPQRGSLLMASYGKGYYIYTGLSFFRELPAGVPGAYKLFANILSIGKTSLKQDKPFKG